MSNYVLFCVMLFAPLVASLSAGSISSLSPIRRIGFFCSACILLSFVIACYFLYSVVISPTPMHFVLWNWISVGNFSVDFSFNIDRVSAVMIFVVTFVSTMVHVYSIGYMSHDDGFNRFFAYLGAFVFSMLLLVCGSNFLVLFIGWEGVGACSYLLIGFWFSRSSANFASIEAFVMNRIADLAMLIGIFLVYIEFGSLEFEAVFANLGDSTMLSLIGILLFVGAMGKSAQFPLHTWLANAMEGPTPVSALIHAATMVTAGVYLVIRCHAIYDLLPDVSLFISYLGTFVAIFAASMAIVNTDLKRIIAYSTLSQLGYMFVAAGLGAYSIALFHLFTHAFFKSLLFLGAGNVMHAMDDKLDITRMGALRVPLKRSLILMSIGSLALAGLFPFAGFFSKDKILEVAFASNYTIWSVLFIASAFTAFYSFRLLALVFLAPPAHDDHPHEASSIMIVPMSLLGVFSIFVGFVHSRFFNFVEEIVPNRTEFHVHNELMLVILTTLLILASMFFALFMYRNGYKHKSRYNVLHTIATHEYFIPKLYNSLFVKPYGVVSRIFFAFIDMGIINKIVDGVAKFLVLLSGVMGPVQNGSLSSYLRLMALGVTVMLIIFFSYVYLLF